MVALTEIVIPETDTPGAKSALVNRFIDLMLSDEDTGRQKAFIEGLAWIDGRSLKLHDKPFVQLGPEAQTELLTLLADPENKKPEDRPGVGFFQELKDLTIFGYYTSQASVHMNLMSFHVRRVRGKLAFQNPARTSCNSRLVPENS